MTHLSTDDGVVDNRQRWDKKSHFILVCVGYAVGLGNVWRFPYLCYLSGGGAFLIPYFLMLVVCGIPMLLLEFAIGQFIRYGPVGAFARICPIFKGVGVATVTMTFFLTTYYNVIIAWAIFYLFSSFQSELPWASCNHTWNTEDCFSHEDYDELEEGELPPNDTVSASEEFFHTVQFWNRIPSAEVIAKSLHQFLALPSLGNAFQCYISYSVGCTGVLAFTCTNSHRVLGKTEGIEDMGGMRWELLGCLALAYIAVYFCIFKGVKSSGRVVYVTALFPYVLLVTLMVTGFTLPGAFEGIKFFFLPKWELLLDAQVWKAAAAQNLGSIGIAFGSMIAFASFNDFHNRSIVRDTLVICLTNSLTSILACSVIFSVLGYIAEIQNAPSIGEVVTSGPGLVFMVYPAAFPTMVVPQLWAVLFFIMLICLGLDSQFAMVEVVITTITDTFPHWKYLYWDRKEILAAYVCIFTFLCGIPCVMEGGIYFFQLMDWYASVVSVGFIAFFEVIAVSWFYDARRLSRNIQQMTGVRANYYFLVCWMFLAPFLLLAILIFSIVDYEVVEYGGYAYPVWAECFGWLIALVSIACIPVGAIHAVMTAKGSLRERLISSLKTTLDDERHAAKFMADGGYSAVYDQSKF